MPQPSPFRFPEGLDVRRFLATHWHQSPLLCPDALDVSPWQLDRHEIFGIATEPGAQCRLVTRRGENWRVEHGPLAEERLDRLPQRNWTLLVQAMEVWAPALHRLIDVFAFLPRWRIDDVMVSLAGEGGGVGPHLDRYDVFLVQAAGFRRWSWGGPAAPFLPDRPLRLLSRFEPTDAVLAGPGDVLYLPPGVPHEGVALDDECMTLSVGLRAPGVVDLADRLADVLAGRWVDDVEGEPRYADAGRGTAGSDPWKIDRDAVEAMRALLLDAASDDATAARMVGEQVTIPRMPPAAPRRAIGSDALLRRLAEGQRLERWAGSRLAWLPRGRDGALLFADGESFACQVAFARWIVRQDHIDTAALEHWIKHDAAIALLARLASQGTFGFAG